MKNEYRTYPDVYKTRNAGVRGKLIVLLSRKKCLERSYSSNLEAHL